MLKYSSGFCFAKAGYLSLSSRKCLRVKTSHIKHVSEMNTCK